jgi:hypothetical protein
MWAFASVVAAQTLSNFLEGDTDNGVTGLFLTPLFLWAAWAVTKRHKRKQHKKENPAVDSPKVSAKKPEEVKKVKEEDLDRYEQKDGDDSSEEEVKENLEVFEERLKQVNKDLTRLEPVR